MYSKLHVLNKVSSLNNVSLIFDFNGKCIYNDHSFNSSVSFLHLILVCRFQMRMIFLLPTLLLAFVPIKSSSPQSPSFNEGWFPVLKYSHNTACIPKNSKCALQDQIRFPRDTRKRFQERHKRGIFGPERHTRGIFDPLPVQRNPGFCCGYCSCETDCFKYGSCCLWMYESLSHARKESSGSK